MSFLQRLNKPAKTFSELMEAMWPHPVVLLLCPWLPFLILGTLISLPGVVVVWIGFQVAGKTGAMVSVVCMMVWAYVSDHIDTKKRYEKAKALREAFRNAEDP